MELLQQKLQLVLTSLWLHNPKQLNVRVVRPCATLTLKERKMKCQY